VELQGSFYKSVKGGGSPSVILLHATGTDPNLGDISGLGKTLASKGFNVLRFDFRGHGRSTNFDKNMFWDPYFGNATAFPALAKKKPTPEKIEQKEVMAAKGNYLPFLANDIMAARIALDKMNDAGKTNTGSTYLIGAGDAAGIGLLYMAAEWTRPQTVPQAHILSMIPPPAREIPRGSDYAGKDIAGAIWLSPVLPKGVDAALMKKWIKASPELREKNPVYCLYGADDAGAKSTSNLIVNEVFEAVPKTKDLNKLPFTKAEAIPGTKLTGMKLLGQQLTTEDKILKQLEVLESDRRNVIATPNRNFTKPSILVPSYFGVK
jgi:pimeloyl-ACP methyl ester carboxylesterase